MKQPKIIATTFLTLKIEVTAKDLNWITEESGFEWLYDYDYLTGRVMTVKSFLTNASDPSDEFKAFCNRIKEIASWNPKDTQIMFVPIRRKK